MLEFKCIIHPQKWLGDIYSDWVTAVDQDKT